VTIAERAPEKGTPEKSSPEQRTLDAKFSNPMAKLLLARQWENQHLVAVDPSGPSLAAVRMLAKTFVRPNIEGIEVKAPIFILGTPRCGSTMMQEILSCHDRVAYFTMAMDQFQDPKLFRAVDWSQRAFGLDVRGERYLQDSIMVDSNSPSEAMRFWGEVLRMDPFGFAFNPLRKTDLTADELDRIYTTLRHVISVSIKRGGDRFLNKSPALVGQPLLIRDLFPDAKFIHLVRDGRMVANSMLKLYKLQRAQDIKVNHPVFNKDNPFVPYPRVPGLEAAVQQWGLEDVRTTATVWDSAVKYVNSVKSEMANFYELRYEDFCANPRVELSKLFDFCELPTPGAGAAAVEEKLRNVGVVRHKNSYGDFDVVEQIAGESLRQYGYL
jgi:hypothetical protein